MARLFALDKMAEGPVPRALRAVRDAARHEPAAPEGDQQPGGAGVQGRMEACSATSKEFPYVATTYRLTEHFHFWTKHTRISSVLQPEQFVEIGEELAKEKGIKNGDRVKVRSKRGSYQGGGDGDEAHQSHYRSTARPCITWAYPIHWGFKGIAKSGYLANTLTPFVGDANTQTPEFKSFLVNIEKA